MSEYKLSSNICKVFAIIISCGNRIYSKYYTKICSPALLKIAAGDLTEFKVQLDFEAQIQEKAKKLINSKSLKPTDTEIFSLGSFNVLFKVLNDVHVYVVGDFEENEALLGLVLNVIYEALNFFCKKTISQKNVFDNYETLILLIDEIVDEGIIVTLDPNQVISRCLMKDIDSVGNTPPENQSTFSMVFSSAKNQISRTLNLN